MNAIMQRRYQEIVLAGVAKLTHIFDIELLVSVMSSFCIENGKLITFRLMKKRNGTRSRLVLLNFPSFLQGYLPVADSERSSQEVTLARFNAPFKMAFRKFKNILLPMIWHGFGRCTSDVCSLIINKCLLIFSRKINCLKLSKKLILASTSGLSWNLRLTTKSQHVLMRSSCGQPFARMVKS